MDGPVYIIYIVLLCLSHFEKKLNKKPSQMISIQFTHSTTFFSSSVLLHDLTIDRGGAWEWIRFIPQSLRIWPPLLRLFLGCWFSFMLVGISLGLVWSSIFSVFILVIKVSCWLLLKWNRDDNFVQFLVTALAGARLNLQGKNCNSTAKKIGGPKIWSHALRLRYACNEYKTALHQARIDNC